MPRVFLALAFLALAIPVAAQNPCTSPIATATNPTTVYATMPNYSDARIVDWQLGIFNTGVDPTTGAPVTTSTIPRANWTLVAGTADCYRAMPTELLAVPAGLTQFGAMRARDAAATASAWSPPSNPFVRLAALIPPTAVRVTP